MGLPSEDLTLGLGVYSAVAILEFLLRVKERTMRSHFVLDSTNYIAIHGP